MKRLVPEYCTGSLNFYLHHTGARYGRRTACKHPPAHWQESMVSLERGFEQTTATTAKVTAKQRNGLTTCSTFSIKR
jgi:SH3-like domain-containing protein